ncbi:hydroxymethylglutaryl-CoA lyase [Marisediminitalea aggregata]|uniref:Hydroxymethylglutaryl-CoA lyase n=1 Tax=Marisediminitalea aggregata TaxID=634436 RepID=A0A1M5QE77_9ALTE|nr:hydroxymethylglutaryl-CoA lyase [Marisediminitalea aggregata]SHH12049.1 hydroxymethylglutaryl-CoA lyase [Marisediminitalea aggregata]
MTPNYPTQVSILEVGPRDGLQNEAQTIPLQAKTDFIHALAKAGLTRIEAGSFVSPKWVPQMADSAEVFKGISRLPGVTYSALTPNDKGMQAALESGVDEVAIFAAASEAFSMRNINCSIAESLKRFETVMQMANDNGMKVRGYLSCVMGCPYEGEILPDKVAEVTKTLLDMGCYEVSLGDTIGVGTPGHTHRLFDTLLEDIDVSKLAAHFHDTYGQALANLVVALQYGVNTIDSAAGGLGGCPYAAGASGNVATEDVVYMLNGMGIETGVNLNAVLAASNAMFGHLERQATSRTYTAMLAKCNRSY